MNEKIKELAEQSGLVRGGYANGTDIMTWRESFDNPGSLEKFFQLIVNECYNRAEGQYHGSDDEWDKAVMAVMGSIEELFSEFNDERTN